MSEDVKEPQVNEPDAPAGEPAPAAETARHRRAAQQAQARCQTVEKQLAELRQQMEGRLEQLATAEAQRDELSHQLDTTRRRASAERMLAACGAADLEAGMALLEKRMDFSQDLEDSRVASAIEGLVAEKPFLLGPPAALPGKTAGAKARRPGPAQQLARAAARAATSGSRRDVADYLRLRRAGA
jgi:hypothetical protein